ncbi:MAG: hypothetical protein KDA78_03205, partial [Planctomycetaceae bacterium]|nr:hypothetical protein [Planctomycetaceae bacterium]
MRVLLVSTIALMFSCVPLWAQPLPGTEPLTWEGDIASRLVEECDAFLLKRLEETRHKAFDLSEPQRGIAHQKLKSSLGLVDERIPFTALELVATTDQSSLVGENAGTEIHRVRWPVFGGVHGEGLYLKSKQPAIAWAIVLSDVAHTPEQLCGLVEGIASESQLPLQLAASGVNVIVPALISRDMSKRHQRANLTHREFLHRPAFILGRTMTGYEVQKVLALVDWIRSQSALLQLGIAGYGDGGMLALYASAVDNRIDSTLISGYFENRLDIWNQPIDRQVQGLLRDFGDAELACLVAPRKLMIEPANGPTATFPGEGGAPAELKVAPLAEVEAEFQRIKKLVPQSEAVLITAKQPETFFAQPAREGFL